MRDGREHRTSRISTVVAVLTLCSVSTPPASSSVTTYNPSVAVGYARTGDVTYFGGGASDDSWNAFVDLPWTRETENARITLDYSGRYTSYETFTSLNDLAHDASADYSREFSPRTSLELRARISRSQDQGNPFEPNSGNLFLARRTVRTLGGIGVSLNRRFSRLWSWDVGADATSVRFDEIKDFDPGEDAPPVEDGRTYSIVTGVSREVSERTSLGASYRFGIIQKDVSPDERGHVMSLDYRREIREKGAFGLSVGGYQRSRIDVEDDANYRGSGAYLNVSLGFGEDLGPFQFRFLLGGGPTMGDGLSGTSTNYNAGVTVTQTDYRPSRKWRWSLAARYAYRQPSDRTVSDTATFSTGGSVERQLTKQLSATGSYRWVEQRQQDDEFAPQGSFGVVVFGLVWYPLGGSRAVAGR